MINKIIFVPPVLSTLESRWGDNSFKLTCNNYFQTLYNNFVMSEVN